MERLQQRLTAARQAVASLAEALATPSPTLLERDGAIQRFEYTVEAMWKAAQRFLDVIGGVTVASPKDAARRCREMGLLTDDQAVTALMMMDDRNLTVHVYNEAVAQQIFSRLPQYSALLSVSLERLEARLTAA